MFLGPAAVGKTSLRHGLMNEPLPDKANSTVLAHTRPVRYSWAKTGSSFVHHWTEVSEEDEISEEVRLCHQYGYRARGIGLEESHSDTVQQRSEISVHKEKVISKLKSMPVYSGGKDEVLLHLWDCGGQPVFLDVLPAFLSSRTIFLLMFDASKSLQAPFQVIVNNEGQQQKEEVLEVSILSLLQKWMASIHARFCVSEQQRLPNNYPRIILVGTHADQFAADKPKRERQRRNKQLLADIFAVIKEKEYANIVLGNGILVDNTCAGKSNQAGSGFKKLHQQISKYVQRKLTVKTPVSWVHFRKVLQLHIKKRKPVISLDEVYSIAAECHVPREEVPSALLFYHDLGVFLFYPNIESLKSVVILEPQWLVEQFGKLLAKWRRKSEHMNMWNTFTQYGILVEPLFEAVLSNVQEYGLTPSSLVKILEHFLLAAPIVTEGVHPLSGKVVEFFVPLMLQHHLQAHSSQPPPSPGVVSAAPVHLTFISGYVPPGYYVRLATCLATKKEVKVLFLSGIYRNQITMNVGDVDRLVITEHGDTIELHFSRQATIKKPFRESCHRVLMLLDECFKEIQQWLPGAEVQMAFLCSKCQANTSHASIPLRGKYVTFSINWLVSEYFQCQMGHHFLPSSAERYWLQPDPSLFEVVEVAVPLTGDAVCLLAERLKVDPVSAVVQQFCRNGGDSNELTQAVADVQQMSKNRTLLSQATAVASPQSACVEVSAMKRQHEGDTSPGNDSGTDYDCSSGSTTTKKRKKDDALQKSPKLKELMNRVAAQTKVKWFQVGIQLNIDLATLNAYKTPSSDLMLCYTSVFGEWKRAGELPYTWATIIEALESAAVSEKDTASSVHKWLTDSQ